jgi:hypothetical protein
MMFTTILFIVFLKVELENTDCTEREVVPFIMLKQVTFIFKYRQPFKKEDFSLWRFMWYRIVTNLHWFNHQLRANVFANHQLFEKRETNKAKGSEFCFKM